MNNFTPLMASIGGALIGLAAVGLMALTGRTAGISGIFFNAVWGKTNERLWRVCFVAGLVLASVLWQAITGEVQPFEITEDLGHLIAGGLLVGYGTRLGSGCTSGHGVCGLSRLSPRSLVAVIVFMTTGIATVAAVKAMGMAS
jgi:uncharacterized membrane protein YedE/YeeE